MRSAVVIVALLASAPVAPAAQTLACVGRGEANGHPQGTTPTGETRYRIDDDGRQITVVTMASPERRFCAPGATCTVRTSGAVVEVEVRMVPGADPLYRQRFRLDRANSTFEAGGGGLDGGWSVAGRCTVSRF